ncbi:hypothetical protein FBZ94_1191 [Bradyrhizobium sacchari]|uniref:Uncharacterized protein n=1 Tax=Bradyrhizobium sacchari TaxID=1399419 RepID=A0A560HM77_9BRAD|nr:hypothetical protein FBZ94_1191 [Bradyrhizobium sacchari]TWB66126.1 hypothetical protein FBZ95_1181 [Bradyrhizobium sacchari]
MRTACARVVWAPRNSSICSNLTKSGFEAPVYAASIRRARRIATDGVKAQLCRSSRYDRCIDAQSTGLIVSAAPSKVGNVPFLKEPMLQERPEPGSHSAHAPAVLAPAEAEKSMILSALKASFHEARSAANAAPTADDFHNATPVFCRNRGSGLFSRSIETGERLEKTGTKRSFSSIGHVHRCETNILRTKTRPRAAFDRQRALATHYRDSPIARTDRRTRFAIQVSYTSCAWHDLTAYAAAAKMILDVIPSCAV